MNYSKQRIQVVAEDVVVDDDVEIDGLMHRVIDICTSDRTSYLSLGLHCRDSNLARYITRAPADIFLVERWSTVSTVDVA